MTRETLEAGLTILELGNESVRLRIAPELGGKVVSVTAPSGREFIWQDPTRPLAPVPATATYGDADISGVDDCFPTVDACRYPVQPRLGHPLRDHGEIWGRPLEWSRLGDGVEMRRECEDVPCHLTKRVALGPEPGTVRFDYSIKASAGEPLYWSWTAHPLLRMAPGSAVVITGRPEMGVTFAVGGRVREDGDRHHWPFVEGPRGPVDYSRILGPEEASNDKVWIRAPDDGRVGLVHPDGSCLSVGFDPASLPWVALCVNHGGYPADRPGFWIAIEPSTTGVDRLDRAIEDARAERLDPGGEVTWSWSLRVTDTTGEQA